MFLRCGNEFLDGTCHEFFCGEVSLIGYFETYIMNSFFVNSPPDATSEI